MLRKNQQGFSHVLLFIVAVVLFVGLTAGFFILKNKRDDNKAAKNNDSGIYQDDGKDDTLKSGKQFMSIQEWGVDLPVNENTGTLYYTLRPVEQENQLVEYVDIFSTDIDQLANANGDNCADDTFPIVTLGRTTIDKMDSVSDPDSADYQGQSGQFRTFDFDQTYAYSALGFHQSAPSCAFLNPDDPEAGKDEDVIKAYDKKKSEIIQAFSKLQHE